MKNNTDAEIDTPSKLIWDIPLRIFHWLIVILIFGSWYTVDIAYDMDKHMLVGYALMAVILFRIVWGIVGPRYARFSSFIFGPLETYRYIKSFFSKDYVSYAGHNPLGGIAVLAMLAVIIVQLVTGLFASDDFYVFAPFSLWVSADTSFQLTGIHRQNFNVMLALIIVHVVAIFFYLIFKKQNLIKSMFTGRKPILASEWKSIASHRTYLAIGVIVICSIAVYALIKYAEG